MENTLISVIRKIIADKGFKQAEVAARAGFTPQQFSDMLNRRKIIRAEYMSDIAGALGVDLAELYAGADGYRKGSGYESSY